ESEFSRALGDAVVDKSSKPLEPLFVKDACEAIALVAGHQGGVAEIFNVGGDFQLNVDELAALVKQIEAASTHLSKKASLDCSKIKETLKWTPTTTLSAGLKLTLETNIPAPTTVSPTAKFLVFGGNGWIGTQFTSLLTKAGIPFVVGQTRPGTDLDETVVDEIVRVAPSHIVSMVGRTHGPGVNSIAYLEGGPDKLRENMRDNFYA
uniref:Epimerase domain-containing protein n=1 Tax=Steinernema glaseri TaxID=37863 RepID=A0A1I7YLP2_9BILA